VSWVKLPGCMIDRAGHRLREPVAAAFDLWRLQIGEFSEWLYHFNILGRLLLYRGFDTAAEQHLRLLNHQLLR
ncbi:MAG: hypothetical protein WA821_13440, partial [Anaerolineales bacterium]